MDGGGWGGWRWMVTFPPVNGELGVNRLGTSRLEVGVGGWSRWGGGVNFQSSPGFNMTGFYGDLG